MVVVRGHNGGWYELVHGLEFIEQSIEAIHGGLDRSRAGHVDTSAAEQVNRRLRRAALEETEVIGDGLRVALADLCREGEGCRDTGGVLVDVEVVVKMRDPRPLEADFVVERDGWAVVALDHVVVAFGETLGGQGFVLLGAGVHVELELCEHGLADEGGANVSFAIIYR